MSDCCLHGPLSRTIEEKRICSTWNLQGVFCISVNKNELHKMEDLWKELEVLLQNVKEKVQRKDSSREPSELTECVASFFTDIKEVLSCGSHLLEQSHRTLSLLPEQHRHAVKSVQWM